MSDFERKAKLVAYALPVLAKNGEWDDVIKAYDLGFAYATLTVAKHGTLNEEGKQMVTDTYDFLLESFGVEESKEYQSIWDLTEAKDN